ncbi:hypothetical protein M404DRAFT_618813 [Pisolithus tinctorius Marx 270]|uniref:Uncharacterized protein n=1 Tax=Pisolithus tinctorius Marx 270 TaxID=870435 RepID=A0A0C3K1K0_PISTI|nr:hypothetical protein M404DRAFT_618813 [Pisolithus tinctorius Marx 270]
MAMEDLYGSLKRSGSNIYTDPSSRLSRRLLAPSVHVGEGVGFQDFGSSFAVGGGGAQIPSRPSGSQGSTTSSTRKSKLPSSRGLRRATSNSSSDDELRLSQGSSRSTSNYISKGKADEHIAPAAERMARVNVNGQIQLLPFHPDYKPNNVLKSLKFSKKKSAVPTTTRPEEELPPSSSNPDIDPDDTLDFLEPISTSVLGRGDDGHRTSALRNNNLSAHTDSPSPSSSTTCLPKLSATSKVVTKHSASKDMKGNNGSSAPSAPPKPKPRGIHVPRQSPSHEITPRASGSTRRIGLPLRNKSPVLSNTNCPSKPKLRPRPRVKQKLPEPTRNAPQEFPMSFSAKENLSDGGNSTDTGTTMATNKSKSKGKSRISAHQAKMLSFPIPSPLHARQQSPSKAKPLQHDSTFPMLSPLSKAAYSACTPTKNDKLPTRLGDEEEDGTPHAPAYARTDADVRPFPMSTQLLESINRGSPGSPAKRVSDDSDAGHKRASKKHKDSQMA